MWTKNNAIGIGTRMRPKPRNSLKSPTAEVRSATPYMSRRAGDNRMVNARKNPCTYLTQRRYHGSPSSSAVLMPRTKNR